MRGRARLRSHRFDFFLGPAWRWPVLFRARNRLLVSRVRFLWCGIRRFARSRSAVHELEQRIIRNMYRAPILQNPPDRVEAATIAPKAEYEFAVRLQPGS